MDWHRNYNQETVALLEEFDADTQLLIDLLDEEEDNQPPPKNAMYTRPYPGHIYVKEVMDGHEVRAYNCFRMSATSFRQLTELLSQRSLLQTTKNMPVEEQLAIFLRVVAQADSYRSICEFFQHSLETVSRNFHQVLRALLALSADFIKLPNATTNCSPHIRRNQNFYPFFKDALGAIDGTHIPAIVSVDKQNRYRNRKDFVSQNVMAAVNFERQFLFVATGWEGSAADMRVLRWAVEQGHFNVPVGKYYLVDSGYANTEKFLAPIRGYRYHLCAYRSQEQRTYRGAEELYNHRHAQLRNVVERTFGIVKERFKVLTNMKPFAFPIQADIVVACCVLHNFISRSCSNDVYLNMSDCDLPESSDGGDNQCENENCSTIVGDRVAGETLRDRIKDYLWADRG